MSSIGFRKQTARPFAYRSFLHAPIGDRRGRCPSISLLLAPSVPSSAGKSQKSNWPEISEESAAGDSFGAVCLEIRQGDAAVSLDRLL